MKVELQLSASTSNGDDGIRNCFKKVAKYYTKKEVCVIMKIEKLAFKIN